MVGRDAERAALLDALRQPRPQVVEVAGEPGIGKTTLLSALREGDATVLWGTAAEFERSLPFGVFQDALGEHAELLDGPVLEGERFRLYRDVRARLEALAPLALVLDDLQWAD